uniref:Protein kinase domain-containing protein n=2 Tax=Anopheles atroparvus TaxID=41427 RepID=A0A182J0L3_ANOAO
MPEEGGRKWAANRVEVVERSYRSMEFFRLCAGGSWRQASPAPRRTRLSVGHAHLTDFNIATRLPPDGLACSMSGTKPYMAPEVFMCALEEVAGYSYPVDWWSLGVVAYELRSGTRPFVLHSSTPLAEVKNVLSTQPHFPRHWGDQFISLITKLLNVHPGARISTLKELQQTRLLRGTDFDRVLTKRTNPPFKPSKEHLNCDPSLELEEMIVETKPLHKKKKRLAKQRSIHKEHHDPLHSELDRQLLNEFLVYNRYKELKRKAMEAKESEWQQELDQAMANSHVSGPESSGSGSALRLAPISERSEGGGATGGGPSASRSAEPLGGVSGPARAGQVGVDGIDYIDRTPSPKSTI